MSCVAASKEVHEEGEDDQKEDLGLVLYPRSGISHHHCTKLYSKLVLAAVQPANIHKNDQSDLDRLNLLLRLNAPDPKHTVCGRSCQDAVFFLCTLYCVTHILHRTGLYCLITPLQRCIGYC